jgi:ornithine cyclodeaminase
MQSPRADIEVPTVNSTDSRFLSPADIATLVSARGLETCLRELVMYLEEDFIRWQDFDKCARTASHSPLGVIELMPIADASHYAFKYVNGHPGNPHSGLPTVMAFGVLARVATGMPELVSELTLTTAMRTAAVSALAARALARPYSRSMALIGTGAQAEFQVLAFASLLGVREFRLFDTDAEASAKTMANLAEAGLQLRVCGSAREAVQGADIVTTATADKTNATILTADMIEPGMHINAIGGDCPGKTELAPEVLQQASVFVEYEPQTRIEGDIQQMPAEFPVTELWRVLKGDTGGRVGEAEVTVFDSVGFALEDFSALRFLRDAAIELDLGSPLALVPALADPKNLYAALLGDGRASAPGLAAQAFARVGESRLGG